LPGFAISVPSVAFGLVRRFPRIALGVCRCRDGSLPIRGFCLSAFPLLGFEPLPSDAPLFTACSNCLTFCLSRELGRFGCFLCGTKCLQASSCCVGSGSATIRKFTVPGIFQIFTPVEVLRRRKSELSGAFRHDGVPGH
jgi:hypothetical protein